MVFFLWPFVSPATNSHFHCVKCHFVGLLVSFVTLIVARVDTTVEKSRRFEIKLNSAELKLLRCSVASLLCAVSVVVTVYFIFIINNFCRKMYNSIALLTDTEVAKWLTLECTIAKPHKPKNAALKQRAASTRTTNKHTK